VNLRDFVRIGALVSAISLGAAAPQQPAEEPDVIFPSGKSQREEILKEQHKRNLRDVQEILNAAGQLKEDLEKHDYYVLSLASLKKTERIEKLARQIRSRMRR